MTFAIRHQGTLAQKQTGLLSGFFAVKNAGRGGQKNCKIFGLYLWMVTTEDIEAAVALAEEFKEQIGVGASVVPARAMGEGEG